MATKENKPEVVRIVTLWYVRKLATWNRGWVYLDDEMRWVDHGPCHFISKDDAEAALAGRVLLDAAERR